MGAETENFATTMTEIQEVSSHGEPFYLSAEFFVGVAFVVVVAFLFIPVKKALNALIFQRIARIKNDLQEAENLKLEAQKLYAEYERKLLNKDAEVAEIISEEENFIAEKKENKTRELENFLKQKQIEAESRISLALEQANIEINNAVANRAMDILTTIFQSGLSAKEYNQLIDNSINRLKKIPLK